LELETIGKRLRMARQTKGFTQQDLADKCELTKSMLSKIENGRCPAALATYSRIAKNLGVPLTWFLEENDEEKSLLIIPDNMRRIRNGSNEIGYLYETLANRSRFSHIEPTVVTVPAQLENFELFTHDEDEFIYILDGSINLLYDGEPHPMSQGDSAYFEGTKPHIFLPLQEQEAKVLTVYIQNTISHS
jgi:transcriptional regulator with XRE-family HTH domain